MLEKEILNKAISINSKLISIRRNIHACPEIGFEEIRTSGIVAENLKKSGIEVKTGVAKTGVVGLLRGKYEGKTVLLRADMDCLKIVEKNELDYKSCNKGLMHACGHDVHTTWLLGAAEILSEFKDSLHGNVKFIFQPAEEFSEGAKLMISEGILENPRVDAAIAAHVWPYIETGNIGIKQGAIMAATDNFKITIYGVGGHGAHPNKCKDPIASAVEIYMALQTIISRNVSPLDSVVITVGKFNSGISYNVIPETAFLEGTIRTISEETRNKVPKLMDSIIKGITDANGTKYKFEYTQYHPPVINNYNLTCLVERATEGLFGKDCVQKIDNPSMAGEDFSFFQERVPSTFFWVGIGDKVTGTDTPLHSPNFMIDENMIHKGAALLSQCAVDFLNV